MAAMPSSAEERPPFASNPTPPATKLIAPVVVERTVTVNENQIPAPVSPAPTSPLRSASLEPPLAEKTSERAKVSYGTSVKFVSNPDEAVGQAQREQKLLFTLHISGNFEDARFT